VVAPVFLELSKKFPNVIFLKLNVDECHNLATRYEVNSMPTFVFFRNRQKIHAVSVCCEGGLCVCFTLGDRQFDS